MAWIKDVLDLLKSPRNAVIVFLFFLVCTIPSVRHHLPVHGPLAEYFDLAITIGLPFSAVYLFVSAASWGFTKGIKWRRSPSQVFRRALKKATPLEKLILHALISVNELWIDLTPGTRTALHLQELGLILHFPSRSGYEISAALSDLCIREPKLLKLSADDEETGTGELQRLRDEGQEKRLFAQLSKSSRPQENDWMAL